MKKIFALASCAFLFVTLTIFISAPPSAYAATHTPTYACVPGVWTSAAVYDSYGTTLEGYLHLDQNTCTKAILGEFDSNNNTWQTVTVYVELTYAYGYQTYGAFPYNANTEFFTPPYNSPDCYYAEVDLLDNRGIHNWVGTASHCF